MIWAFQNLLSLRGGLENVCLREGLLRQSGSKCFDFFREARKGHGRLLHARLSEALHNCKTTSSQRNSSCKPNVSFGQLW